MQNNVHRIPKKPNARRAASPEWVADTFLANRYAVSRQCVWRWAKDGRIPPPVKLTPGCTRWRLVDVIAALEVCA